MDPKNPNWRHLDADGLPVIGSTLQPDEVLCCYFNTLTQEYKTIRYHKKEPAHIMSVTLVGDENGKSQKTKAWIMYRIMVIFPLLFDCHGRIVFLLANADYWR